MPSDPLARRDDAALAAEIAAIAGDYLCSLRDRQELSGKALGAAGDEGANQRIIEMLRRERPDDAILSEECADVGHRASARRVWIVDPLDGTREYGEGRDDWAVHVALALDGIAAIGAVALPSLGTVMRSDEPSPLPAAGDPLRMVVSRTRPAKEAVAVAEALGAVLVPMGSAGAKAMAVVRGQADIYLHSGGQYEWDNAAPVAVASAFGLYCARLDGSPMRYNSADPSLGDFLICRAELADLVVDAMEKTTPRS